MTRRSLRWEGWRAAAATFIIAQGSGKGEKRRGKGGGGTQRRLCRKIEQKRRAKRHTLTATGGDRKKGRRPSFLIRICTYKLRPPFLRIILTPQGPVMPTCGGGGTPTCMYLGPLITVRRLQDRSQEGGRPPLTRKKS